MSLQNVSDADPETCANALRTLRRFAVVEGDGYHEVEVYCDEDDQELEDANVTAYSPNQAAWCFGFRRDWKDIHRAVYLDRRWYNLHHEKFDPAKSLVSQDIMEAPYHGLGMRCGLGNI